MFFENESDKIVLYLLYVLVYWVNEINLILYMNMEYEIIILRIKLMYLEINN